MPFSLGGYPVLDPTQALRTMANAPQSAPLPIATWADKANFYACTRGCAPGVGYMLVQQVNLDKILTDAAGDSYLELKAYISNKSATFPKILVAGHAECLTPGMRDQAASIYLLPIADRRWLYWERGDTITEQYNVRSNDGNYTPGGATPGYLSGTLNAGTAWTWQLMVNDIWPSAAGTAPTLPFTPHGTPEGWEFDGITRFKALQIVLDRLACDLVYQPIADTFRIARLGDTAGAGATAWETFKTTYAPVRIWDDIARVSETVRLPATVRVQFRIIPQIIVGGTPFWTVDVSTGQSDPLQSGTYVLLNDDLYALSTGKGSLPITTASLALLTARAAERETDYVRVRTYEQIDDHRIYSGVIGDDAVNCLGEIIAGVSWEDRPRTESSTDGMKTSMMTGREADHRFEDWQTTATTNDEVVDPCCPEFHPPFHGGDCRCDCCDPMPTLPGGGGGGGGNPGCNLKCPGDQIFFGGAWWSQLPNGGLYWCPNGANAGLPEPPNGPPAVPATQWGPAFHYVRSADGCSWDLVIDGDPPRPGGGGGAGGGMGGGGGGIGGGTQRICQFVWDPSTLSYVQNCFDVPRGGRGGQQPIVNKSRFGGYFRGQTFKGGILILASEIDSGFAAGVSSFNTRTGAVTLTAADVKAVQDASLTASNLTINTNNWNPGAARYISVQTDGTGGKNITGKVASSDGDVMYLENPGIDDITLVMESGSSTAANRFNNGSSGASLTLTALSGNLIGFEYAGVLSRWRHIATI